jgi:predicted NBD/HSP70 family sugar kinase
MESIIGVDIGGTKTCMGKVADIEDAFGRKVCVSNDANCFALGEWVFGIGGEYNNMVCLTLGTGIGTGIITNGNLCT